MGFTLELVFSPEDEEFKQFSQVMSQASASGIKAALGGDGDHDQLVSLLLAQRSSCRMDVSSMERLRELLNSQVPTLATLLHETKPRWTKEEYRGFLRRKCGACLELGATSRCSGCRRVLYCSGECQKKHWRHHKQECKESKNPYNVLQVLSKNDGLVVTKEEAVLLAGELTSLVNSTRFQESWHKNDQTLVKSFHAFLLHAAKAHGFAVI